MQLFEEVLCEGSARRDAGEVGNVNSHGARVCPEVVELACKNLKTESFIPSIERLESASPSDMRYRQRWLLKSCCTGIETWEGWDKLARHCGNGVRVEAQVW
jgi:hypothetical protein